MFGVTYVVIVKMVIMISGADFLKSVIYFEVLQILPHVYHNLCEGERISITVFVQNLKYCIILFHGRELV